MGGRGKGGGNQQARNVATALGIARYEIGSFVKNATAPPPLYPKVNKDPLPFETTEDLVYIARMKMELDQRLRDSSFFVEKEKKREIRRYVDKYSIVEREKLELDMSRLPAELEWRRAKKSATSEPKSKKKKLDEDERLKEKLRKLEQQEQTAKDDDDEEGRDKPDDASEKSEGEGEPALMSDEDYQEEDNDYITAYFDNGEGYGDGGSDDNMDGDEY